MNNLSFRIARRYLFAKKSTNAINLITGISVLGISIGTASLILVLSVFPFYWSFLIGSGDRGGTDIAVDGDVPVSVLRSRPHAGVPTSPDAIAKWVNRILGLVEMDPDERALLAGKAETVRQAILVGHGPVEAH